MATHVRCGSLFTGNEDAARANQTLVVDDTGRLAFTGPAESAPKPAKGDIALDYSDFFVMPGLHDVHTHLAYGNAKTEEDIDLYQPMEFRSIRGLYFAQKCVAAGYTSICSPGDAGQISLSVRNAINFGLFEGPRVTAAGRYLTTRQGLTDWNDLYTQERVTELGIRPGLPAPVLSKPTEEPPMTVARHPMPAEVAALSLDEIAQKYVARFRDRKADWAAFEDAKLEGFKRAQHRFIGAGGSGKHGDAAAISPRAFTLSIMYVEPGQGNAAHTHEVEEIFFVLQGYLTAFIQDAGGRRIDIRLGPWECIACPPGVIHGYVNDSLEPVYFQVMLGKGRPDAMGYADDELYQRRDAHLKG